MTRVSGLFQSQESTVACGVGCVRFRCIVDRLSSRGNLIVRSLALSGRLIQPHLRRAELPETENKSDRGQQSRREAERPAGGWLQSLQRHV